MHCYKGKRCAGLITQDKMKTSLVFLHILISREIVEVKNGKTSSDLTNAVSAKTKDLYHLTICHCALQDGTSQYVKSSKILNFHWFNKQDIFLTSEKFFHLEKSI